MLLGILAGASLAMSSSAKGGGLVTLFTTTQDWSQFTATPYTGTTSTAWDADGSTINGIGNSTAPGGLGTAGSLELDTNDADINYGSGAYSDESGNQLFMTAIDPGSTVATYPPPNYTQVPGSTTAYSGTLYLTFTYPNSSGGYFGNVGILLNYSNNYQTFFPTNYQYLGNTGALQLNTVVETIPYSINAVANNGYFNLDLYDNAGATGVTSPYYVDNLQVAVPEPATLGVLGSGLAMLAFRRRRRA